MDWSVSTAFTPGDLNDSTLDTHLRSRLPLIKVADMSGYPTRKALSGGPHTRTNAVMTAYTRHLFSSLLISQLNLTALTEG